VGSRLRVLYFGPGDSALVRGRIAPFADRLDARWVASSDVPDAWRRRHPQVPVHRLPRRPLRRLPLGLRTADYLAEAAAVVARFRPHVIHVHYAAPLDALALLPIRRTPLVVTVMGGDVLDDQVPRPWPLDGLVRGLLGRAAAVTIKSTFLGEACRRLGAPPGRLRLVRWGVDTARFTPGAAGDAGAVDGAADGSSAGTVDGSTAEDREASRRAARGRLRASAGVDLGAGPVLLSSRALRPLYQHHAVVSATAALPAEARPTLVFTRSAEDPVTTRLVAAQAAAAGVRAVVLPAQAPEAMPDLYRASDACASVPRSDGLPQTLLEALACQVPVVTLDLPAYRELPFAADAHLRVAHDGAGPDPSGLAAAIEAALSRRPRPGLDAARTWIQAHAEREDSLAQVLNLYRELGRS
jgi:glycosyltransferase involved in cell wall biosynthesis